MKDVAAVLIILVGILTIFQLMSSSTDDYSRWVIYLSPNTDICYEARETSTPLGIGVAMSPVDDSFCEDK